MNSTQFWILNGVSSLVVILFLSHVLLLRNAEFAQAKLAYAQQFVQAGQVWDTEVKRLAIAIYQSSATDPALKDILVKEGFTISPNPQGNTTAPTDNP